MFAPLTEVKVKTAGLVQVVQSCRGLPVAAVVVPPVPDSLHWNPAVAAVVVVVKTNVGVRLFDSTAAAEEM